mmetsp:Transcript_22507/g.52974  ORF Transcript_22507/g.52974 Transcript_22507/m.52974 type:complete len:282 (+) Transcript_22507:147-992(+)
MGQSQSISTPGMGLGDYAFSLQAEVPEATDGSAPLRPRFVLPRRRTAAPPTPVVAGYVPPAVSGHKGMYPDLVPVGMPVAATPIAMPEGSSHAMAHVGGGYAAMTDSGVEAKMAEPAAADADDAPVWEDCPLSDVMSYEQLETILARVNGYILPLLLESRVVKEVHTKCKKKRTKRKLVLNNTGDMAGNGFPIWGRQSEWDMNMFARVANDALRKLAEPIEGLEAVTVHAHRSKVQVTQYEMEPGYHLLFIFTEPHGSGSTRVAAGGAGVANPLLTATVAR